MTTFMDTTSTTDSTHDPRMTPQAGHRWV